MWNVHLWEQITRLFIRPHALGKFHEAMYSIEKVIGKGAFGQVAKGTAVDLRGRPGNTFSVAVLKLINNS